MIDALWDIPGQAEKNVSPVRCLCPFGADDGGQAGQDAPAHLSLLDRSRGERVKRIGHGSHRTHQGMMPSPAIPLVQQLKGLLVPLVLVHLGFEGTWAAVAPKVGLTPLTLRKCLNMAGAKDPGAA